MGGVDAVYCVYCTGMIYMKWAGVRQGVHLNRSILFSFCMTVLYTNIYVTQRRTLRDGNVVMCTHLNRVYVCSGCATRDTYLDDGWWRGVRVRFVLSPRVIKLQLHIGHMLMTNVTKFERLR